MRACYTLLALCLSVASVPAEFPSSCAEIRRGSSSPLPSGIYDVYLPGSVKFLKHGWTPKKRTVFCKMDGTVNHHMRDIDELEEQLDLETPGGFGPDGMVRDCADIILQNRTAESGVYTIYNHLWFIPGEHGIHYLPIFVWCDMETDGGGWTLFQRREDGTVNFTRTWYEYERGFGTIAGEHWIGLFFINLLTYHIPQSLRIDMVSRSDVHTFSEYGHFSVANATTNYKLNIDNFLDGNETNRPDLMMDSHGMSFSTWDRDHDTLATSNCALIREGGFWFTNCGSINLNGNWRQATGANSIYWLSSANTLTKTFVTMAIRQSCF